MKLWDQVSFGMKHKEEITYETYQNFDDERFKGIHEEGRMRRMPDILSVGL